MVVIPAPNHEGIKPPNRRNLLYLPNDTHQVHQCLIQPFMAQVNEQSIRRGVLSSRRSRNGHIGKKNEVMGCC